MINHTSFTDKIRPVSHDTHLERVAERAVLAVKELHVFLVKVLRVRLRGRAAEEVSGAVKVAQPSAHAVGGVDLKGEIVKISYRISHESKNSAIIVFSRQCRVKFDKSNDKF